MCRCVSPLLSPQQPAEPWRRGGWPRGGGDGEERGEAGFRPSQVSQEKNDEVVVVCSQLQVQEDLAGELANFNLI